MEWFLAVRLARHRQVASATVALAAGVAAATSVAVGVAAMRSADALDRIVAHADAPEVFISFCPPGYDPGVDGDIFVCTTYLANDEAAAIREMPGVEDATTAVWTNLSVAPASGMVPARPMGIEVLLEDTSIVAMSGRPLVVAGDLDALDRSDTVALNEDAADVLGVHVGDDIVASVTLPGLDDADPSRWTVGAIVRPPLMLFAGNASNAQMYAGPALAGVSEVAGFTSLGVDLEPGITREDLAASMEAEFADRGFNMGPNLEPHRLRTLRDGARVEARAIGALAALIALAAVFFVGQTVGRQTRLEMRERHTLVALGATRRQLVGAVVARWLPVAALAGVIAAAGAVALSVLGPIGVGRRAPWSRGVYVDIGLLTIGVVTVIVLVLAAAVVGTRQRPIAARSPVVVRRSTGGTGAVISVALGLLAGPWRRVTAPIGTAVAGTAIAVAALVAAVTLSGSIRTVMSDPVHTGAPYDAIGTWVSFGEESGTIDDVVAGIDGITAAAILMGDNVEINGEELWLQGFVPVEGLPEIGPIVVAGRAPVDDDEIAIGSLTARDLGVEIGDELLIERQAAALEPFEVTVVGTTMINDAWEPNAGIGVIASPALITAEMPELTQDNVAVSIRDDAVLDDLREAFSEVQVAAVPTGVRYVERVAWVPVALGMMVAVMATVTFLHAVLLAIRAQRREMATCRALGFVRRQVVGVIETQSVLIAVGALLIGVPLGVMIGRWGWTAIAQGLGLALGPQLEWPLVIAICGGVVGLAAAIAIVPAWRLARVAPATILRTE